MTQEEHIKQLLDRYINDLSTAEEKRQLMDAIDSRHDVDWYAMLASSFSDEGADKNFTPERWQPVLDSILGYQPEKAQKKPAIIRYISSRWAVAAMLMLLFGAGLWLFREKNTPTPDPMEALADITPGSNRAVLTLQNGQQIPLDSMHGNIVLQGNLHINNDSGALNYNDQATAAAYHTLSVPRSGQYRLQLPDGTKVWLNAASSITYPTSFTGDKRTVSITGEAYFEVAKNPSKPFIVQVNQMYITVLGTHFNINAYSDEPDTRTTLLEGAVSVTAGQHMTMLSPGQQVRLDKNNALTVANDVDVEDVIAWKNGYTVFENADIETIMRQVSRWYNVEVVFEGNMPKRHFVGGISRKSSLKDLLKVLEFENVNFTIEGKKIIVKP